MSHSLNNIFVSGLSLYAPTFKADSSFQVDAIVNHLMYEDLPSTGTQDDCLYLEDENQEGVLSQEKG